MQTPDTQPGEYYVTVVDGPRRTLLLGPYTNWHQGALDRVEDVRREAEKLDPRAVFYAFGTARLPGDDSVPIRAGKFNSLFGLPTDYPTTKE